jgi:hypothetical protein
MQWFGRRQEEDPQEFWQRTAARRGGEIGFLTFATLLGRSSDQPLELPGLLYTVGDQAWFEDFERDNWLFKIMGGRKKFEKTEISFGRSEIRSSQLVSRSGALRCVAGTIPPEKLPPVSALGRFFSTPVVQIALTNGTSLFFDMIRRDDFIKLVKKGEWPKAGAPPATTTPGTAGAPPTP